MTNLEYLKENSVGKSVHAKDLMYFKECIMKESDPEKKQIHLRAYIRTFCSLIEYAAHYYKLSFIAIIQSAGLEKELPVETLMFLHELEWKIEGNGKLKTQPNKRIRTRENIKALLVFAKEFVPGSTVETDGEGWNKLNAVYDIRDRLTHSIAVQEGIVSDAEFKDVKLCAAWFSATIVGLNEKIFEIVKGKAV